MSLATDAVIPLASTSASISLLSSISIGLSNVAMIDFALVGVDTSDKNFSMSDLLAPDKSTSLATRIALYEFLYFWLLLSKVA